jgi:chitinase
MPQSHPFVWKSVGSFALALALVSCSGPVEPDELSTRTSQLVADGEYVIRSVHSGKCLDITAASTADGARVQQWDCNGTGAQRFRVVSVGGGFQRITNVLSD